MITCSLQSGSNGNAIYVEADGVRLLFDGGISGRQARQRLAARGRDIRAVDALLLSHDHTDHVCCAGIYQRRFGLPIYVTRPTFRRIRGQLGKVNDVRHFAAGDTLVFGPVAVHTCRTPHDAVDGVVFIVESRGRRLGIFTDLGHPFAGLPELLESVDAAYLESNYDPRMLAEGPYPPHLQARIRGSGGHLSNPESAELIRQCGPRRYRWIALAHLSEHNNRPEVAVATHRAVLGERLPLVLASRYGPSPLLEV